MALKGKKTAKVLSRLYQFTAKIVCLFFFLTLIQVFVFRFIDYPFAMSDINLRIRNISSSQKHIIPRGEWRSIKHISPNLVKAVLAAEDQRFIIHSGFDYQEIYRAIKDINSDRKLRGASTITMQMARTVFLWQDRSVTRKIAEAYYTVLIEFAMPKARIMELYLNTVYWGAGIRGAEAASKKYFNKAASELTAEEAALLAVILRGPHAWSPANPDEYLISRQKRILKDMEKMHL
ncbi:MAG: monofunctional biosynthetic peptidoglycan transglycosylase [Deltaproteobacteria bacterium]|nr:monofunctional biosynthetic peptidoglycan transglycosylase [Deltaproteobacteria bacterium]